MFGNQLRGGPLHQYGTRSHDCGSPSPRRAAEDAERQRVVRGIAAQIDAERLKLEPGQQLQVSACFDKDFRLELLSFAKQKEGNELNFAGANLQAILKYDDPRSSWEIADAMLFRGPARGETLIDDPPMVEAFRMAKNAMREAHDLEEPAC